MELVKPSFEIITPNAVIFNMLERIEMAGRTCYKSEANVTADSAKEFVAKIIKMGHESVIEHEQISVRIICDRGVTHEIVRHRLASYSQESTRYCNYKDQPIQFVIPSQSDLEAGVYTKTTLAKNKGDSVWLSAMLNAESCYKQAMTLGGWSPQQARAVLPNSLKTEIVMTCNLREWRHFFNLRCAPAAHPDMRAVALPMLKEFARLIPVVFDDLVVKFLETDTP